MRRIGRIFTAWLRALLPAALLAALMSGMYARGNGRAQSPQDLAAAVLQQMTPKERIGQLFLVTFQGMAVGENTAIDDLIRNHHIGGVALLAKNDNIITGAKNPQAAIDELQAMVTTLQKKEWDASQTEVEDPNSGISRTPMYAPLLIGVSQEGDGYPYDQILSGITTLPSAMAIGATWSPDLAADVGRVQGSELASLGVNLLMGPTLDVLDSPHLETSNNLSTRAFGGDPYWVGKLGQAYIQGVHQGASGRVAVAAKHFPGHGSADRLPEEEVATVRKSLDELISFDLAPFVTITGGAPSSDGSADALLTSHIRYQGLQGNIRSATRPVSFDPQALALLFQQPGLSTWRANGGVMVSDDLGNQAVRRFYDQTSQTFDARRVALNAFLAGNDILYIADFSSASEPNSYTEAIRTLDFFTQKYRDDPAFAQRVDDSALRILMLKARLYPGFSLDDVLAATKTQPVTAADGRTPDQIVFSVAQRAATLLSPSQAELDVTIPDPPNLNDRIVFITDTRTYQACSDCPAEPELEMNALQDAVVRLYGPQAASQVVINNLSSYSLDDLERLLNKNPVGAPLEQSLERAGWIVFGMLNEDANLPSFHTLRRALNERPDLFQQKRVIVFGFGAPYYLDATDISKLSAYYALYSKASAFLDVAAYLLFDELNPTGASPVSAPGIRYDLNEALFPDSSQAIGLFFDIAAVTVISGTTTPEPSAPVFRPGDVIPLRTGIILDHNRNPVPDGTPVTFIFSLTGDPNSIRQSEVTRDGVARTTFAVNTTGALEIRAESESARSDILRVDIPSPGGETATAVVASPTPEPSQTPVTPVVPPTPMPTEAPEQAEPDEPMRLGLADWGLAVLIAAGLGFLAYRMAAYLGYVRWGIRAALLALVGGLAAYSYLAALAATDPASLSEPIKLRVLASALVGGLAGLAATAAWRYALVKAAITGPLPEAPQADSSRPRGPARFHSAAEDDDNVTIHDVSDEDA